MTDEKAQLILNELKDGAKRPSELERLLVKSGGMAHETFLKNLNSLVAEKKVLCDDSKRKKGIVTYYLPSSRQNICAEISKVLKNLRLDAFFLREPTAKEVAACIGETPEEVRNKLYKTADLTGWREQTDFAAQEEAKNALILAVWLKWEKSGYNEKLQLSEMSRDRRTAAPEETARAQKIYENFPNLLPYVSSDMVWPEEIRKAWKKSFLGEPPLPDVNRSTLPRSYYFEIADAVKKGRTNKDADVQ